MYPYLRLNLCSASHVVRLLTLKILVCFDQPENTSLDNKVGTVLLGFLPRLGKNV